MNKPKLYILIGISASGKSTYANELSQRENCIIISLNKIHEEIYESKVLDQSNNGESLKIFYERIKKNLLKGNNVIADNTNITIKSRRAIFNVIKDIECEKIGIVIVKDIEDCIKDNRTKKYPISEEIIYNQIKKYQIPFKEEGFDAIKIHQPYLKNIEPNIIKRFLKDMENFDQKSPYHNQTLKSHCIYTYNNFKKYNYDWCYNVAAQIHDYGKLFTQSFNDNGVACYYGHENYGTYYILTNLYNLYFDGNVLPHELFDFLFLINYHMLPMNWNTEKIKKRWKNIFGEFKYQLLLDFNKCDKMRINNNLSKS